MADIKFYCPTCSKKMAIDEQAAGLIVHCPDCRTEVTVPRQSETAPPGAAPTPPPVVTPPPPAPKPVGPKPVAPPAPTPRPIAPVRPTPEKPAAPPPSPPVAPPPPAPKPIEPKPIVVAPAPSPELEALKREQVRLTTELHTARSERDAQTALVTDLTGKLTTATASLERITTELTTARQQHTEQLRQREKQLLEQHQQREEHLQEQLRQRDEQLRAVTDLRIGAESERDAANARLAHLTNELTSAQATIAGHTDTLKKETTRLNAEIATVRAERDTLSGEMTELTARLTTAEQELNRARAERAEQNNRITAAEAARTETLARLEQQTAELAAERAAAAEHQTRFAAELLAVRNESTAERAKAHQTAGEQSAQLIRQIEEIKSALAAAERERDAAKQAAARVEAEKHQLIEQHQRALADKDKQLAAKREVAVQPPPVVEAKETAKISVSDATAYRDPFRLMLRRIFLYVSVAALAVVGATLLMTRFAPDKPPVTATDATTPEPAAPPARRETIEAQLDTEVIIDDLAITISNPRVEPITLVSVLGSEMMSDESYLVIDLIYSNQSTSSETILYQPWNNAELKDNTGRRFRPALLGQSDIMHEVKGRVLIQTLKPGEVVTDVILFPWRPGDAESFTLLADPDFRRIDDRDRAVQRSPTMLQLTMPIDMISTGLRTEVVP